MPTYCFVCEKCGKGEEIVAEMSKMPEGVKCDNCGTQCHRDFLTEQGGMGCGDTWNQTGGFTNKRGETGSLSRAIHSDQVAEQMALDKKKGVSGGVEWKPDGKGMARPHYSSKSSRDKWDKAHGFTSDNYY